MADQADFSREVQATSLALIKQYGDDAEVIATLQAAELAAVGDIAGLEKWDEIIACISAIASAAGSGRSARLH